MKYRKKPIVIDAFQLHDPDSMDGIKAHDANDALCDWFASFDFTEWESTADGIHLPTLEGVMLASPGDYIIRGIQGEFYPCKPDIFEATYEKVEE